MSVSFGHPCCPTSLLFRRMLLLRRFLNHDETYRRWIGSSSNTTPIRQRRLASPFPSFSLAACFSSSTSSSSAQTMSDEPHKDETDEATTRRTDASEDGPRDALLRIVPDQRLRVALIGRPNVGKSTLFNRLVGYHRAIEHKTPGVTRDCVERRGEIDGLQFTVIDTPGLDSADVVEQASRVMQTADLALLVVDAKTGITVTDMALRKWIAKKRVPAILVLNKCDRLETEDTLRPELIEQVQKLRMKRQCEVAAANGFGIRELGQVLKPFIELHASRTDHSEIEEEGWSIKKKPRGRTDFDSLEQLVHRSVIRLAIVGRPNVGKSTLFNALVGQSYARVADEAGTTRDPVELRCMFGDRKIFLVDTAGIRSSASTRKDVIRAEAERMAVRAIGRSNVAILVVDATKEIQRGDLRVAHEVLRQGKCLVLAANKWDQIPDGEREERIAHLQMKLRTSFHAAAGMACVLCSATTKQNLALLLDNVVSIYEKWNTRLDSDKLSRFIQRLFLTRPLAAAADIVSVAQTAVRPPTFTLQMRKNAKLREDDEKFILNNIRAEFGLEGVPLRIVQRKQIDMVQFSAGKRGRSVPIARRLMAIELPQNETDEQQPTTDKGRLKGNLGHLKKGKVTSTIFGFNNKSAEAPSKGKGGWADSKKSVGRKGKNGRPKNDGRAKGSKNTASGPKSKSSRQTPPAEPQ